MHDEIFGFTGDALGSVTHLALLLIIASLVIALLVRLGVSIVATERVKVRKQAAPQPVASRKWPVGVAEPKTRTRSKGEPSPELLTAAVMRYLDQMEACNPEPKSEQTEEHVIRSQKDTAAELFRSARLERMQQKEFTCDE